MSKPLYLPRAFQVSNVTYIFMTSRPDRKATYLVRYFFRGGGGGGGAWFLGPTQLLPFFQFPSVVCRSWLWRRFCFWSSDRHFVFWRPCGRASWQIPYNNTNFFFQAPNFLVKSLGLLNDLFPFPSILDAGYPVFLSSFGRYPVWCPPICTWVFLVIFWLEVSN